MEAKYGRLFTEGDVKRMLEMAVLEGAPPAEEQIAAHEEKGWLTFPADEPLFLLRGQDECAPDAIATGARAGGERYPIDYVQSCLNRRSPGEHIQAVWQAAADMRDWQKANPERVKVAD